MCWRPRVLRTIGIYIAPLLLLPTPANTFLASIFGFGAGTTQAPTDPCASSAEPEKCHYNQAVALLASMGTAPAGSKLPQPTLAPVIGLVAPEAVNRMPDTLEKNIPHPFTGSGLRATTTPPAAVEAKEHEGHVTDSAQKEEQSVALLLALGALEGDGLPSSNLEKVTIQLENTLDDLKPGVLADFRARRLAEVMNHHGPLKPAGKRASEALAFLEQVRWPTNSAVVAAIRDLQSNANGKPISLLHGTSHGFELANSESGGQLLILLFFAVSVFMLDRVAQNAAMLPHYEEQRYGAMGHAAAVH